MPTASSGHPQREQLEKVLWPLLAAAAFLGAWEVAVVATHTNVIPSPLDVLKGIAELARMGILLRYLRDSMIRVGAGYLAAVAAGVPLGIAMGLSRTLMSALNPVVQLLRPISPLAWIPVSILVFGVTNLATILLIFMAAFFPIALAAAEAIRNVPVIFFRAGRNFGFSGVALLRRLIPAALPELLVGLRISLGTAWMVLVAAEMIAVDSGLGYLIMDARNSGKRYDLVVAGMVIIGVVGLLLDLGMRRLERLPQVRWMFRD